jgi:sporulation protein YlmC with PRC-barrel domain
MATTSGHTQAIRANKVIGTAVKDSQGDNIGKVEDIVLDKTSNNIMFAVVGFGGILGMGEKFHSVPWTVLNYDEKDHCYAVNMTKDQLKSAPADTIDAITRSDGVPLRDSSFDYYGADRYWQ